MTDPAQTYFVLFGLAGLANPVALLLGGALGWYADARAKLVIAGFAAAAFSIVIDAAIHLSGLAPVGGYDGGAMAVFPFRWVGAGLAAALIYALRGRLKKNG